MEATRVNGTATNGEVLQVIGPVVDVEFPDGAVPNILDALTIDREAGTLVLEVQQHLGENRVRTIAMDSTDGLTRNTAVVSTGGPITMPVGAEIRGRLFNVIGEAIDGLPQPTAEGRRSIHSEPPAFEMMSVFSPTSRPRRSTSGPPLLPGLMAASVCT